MGSTKESGTLKPDTSKPCDSFASLLSPTPPLCLLCLCLLSYTFSSFLAVYLSTGQHSRPPFWIDPTVEKTRHFHTVEKCPTEQRSSHGDEETGSEARALLRVKQGERSLQGRPERGLRQEEPVGRLGASLSGGTQWAK